MIFKRLTKGWRKLRDLAWQRSEGKCELCGFDIADMMKRLDAYQAASIACQNVSNTQAKRFAAIMYGKKARNWPGTCWAADHINPISEGGDSIPPLEEIRILCLECHDSVTAELRKRLSERRKNHRWMPFVL